MMYSFRSVTVGLFYESKSSLFVYNYQLYLSSASLISINQWLELLGRLLKAEQGARELTEQRVGL